MRRVQDLPSHLRRWLSVRNLRASSRTATESAQRLGRGAVEAADAQRRRLAELRARGHVTRGDYLVHQRQFRDAAAAYASAIELVPDSEELHLKRGSAYRELGELEQAIEAYDQAIRRNPTYTEAYFNRGVARYEQNQIEQAVSDFGETIRLDPQHQGAYYQRGLAYESMGRPGKLRTITPGPSALIPRTRSRF